MTHANIECELITNSHSQLFKTNNFIFRTGHLQLLIHLTAGTTMIHFDGLSAHMVRCGSSQISFWRVMSEVVMNQKWQIRDLVTGHFEHREILKNTTAI